MANILISKYICQKDLLASLNESDKECILKLYKDNNFVAFKTQIHSSLHNITCFKYIAATSEKR